MFTTNYVDNAFKKWTSTKYSGQTPSECLSLLLKQSINDVANMATNTNHLFVDSKCFFMAENFQGLVSKTNLTSYLTQTSEILKTAFISISFLNMVLLQTLHVS